MSENRVATADYTVQYLDRVGTAEVLAIPEDRKEFILGLGYDDFKNWLIRINGMARGMPNSEREIDGPTVITPNMLPPEPEDKESILEASLEAAKSILNSRENTEEALRDVSLLFGGVVNYVHLFNDGNGRTSRIAGLLVREGYDGSENARGRLRAVMGTSGDVVLQNNPFDLTPWLDMQTVRANRPKNANGWPVTVRTTDNAGREPAMDHLTPEAREKIRRVLHDYSTAAFAITATMIERGLLPEGVDFTDRAVVGVSREAYLKNFTDDDIEAASQWSRTFRRERVLTFIDAMRHPDHYPIHLTEYTDNAFGQERDTTLRDYYADFIEANSRLYNGRYLSSLGAAAMN